MPQPIILSTWSFGKRANAAAWPILQEGGGALDAVEAACRDAEADPNNHTVGLGGYPDSEGNISLDASIMLSPSRCGGVAAVRQTLHPITLARRVMENTKHFLLAGEAADGFARQQGIPATNLLTDDAIAAWKKWQAQYLADQRPKVKVVKRNIEELGLEGADRGDLEATHDTIGSLALDSHGTLAGGCTTSGLAFKLPGRVGDSPIIGHGLYVDPRVGAAVTTGHGELAMGVCASFLAIETMRRGASPLDAGIEVMDRIIASYELETEDQLGIIVLHKSGQWNTASLREGFRVAVRTSDRDELVESDRVLLGK